MAAARASTSEPCWQCGKDPGPGWSCAVCKAIQPPRAGATFFDAFGLSPGPTLDSAALEKQFHALSKQIHPDRFAQNSPRERRYVAEHAARLNQAYRTLRDPADCANYFLGLQGIAVDKASAAMPPDFLEAMLDQRESLARARAAHDLDRARALRALVQERADVTQREAKARFDAWQQGNDRAQLEQAALQLAELRYLRRFIEEVEAMEMEALGATSTT